MTYTQTAELPDNIQSDYTPDEQGVYLRVYNEVFSQTSDELKATLAAVGAVRKMRVTGVVPLRRAANGDLIMGGWAMKFAKSSKDTDSYETYFSTLTKLMLEYYKNAPLWWEHGQDNDYGVDPIGMRTNTQIYRHGIFLEHNAYKSHFRFNRTEQAVENGEVSYSSDSIQHYMERGFNYVDGRMDVWPMAGCSLTRSPAEISLGPVVSMRSYVTALKSTFEHLPKPEALEAQGRRIFVIPPSIRGVSAMDPQQLAALAEFLGVEATPEAVAAALTELLTQIGNVPAEAAQQSPEAVAMMTGLAPALGLPAGAAKADIVGKLEAIKKMLVAPERTSRALKMDALKRFTGLVNDQADETPADGEPAFFHVDDEEDDDEEDDVPASRGYNRFNDRATSRSSRLSSIRHNRGARRPGLLDVIGAITQVQGAPLQFDMPAFKSQRTSAPKALRAMNINSGQNGGWMLNREMSDELLEALYSKLIFDRLGVTNIPMSGIESITMNRIKSGATAFWAGEDQTTPDSGETQVEAAVTLNLRELICEYPISNRLLANSSSQLESMIENDILAVMRRKKEKSFLYGTGSNPGGSNTGSEPLGLYNTTGVTKTALGNKAITIDNLVEMEGRIEDADIEYGPSMAFVSHNRARRGFKKMKDANGDPLFMESYGQGGIREMDLMGYDFVTSTAVPITSSQTDLFLGEWESAIIGQGQDLEMIVDTSVLMRTRRTLIQVVDRCDFGVAYKEAFQILTGAKV